MRSESTAVPRRPATEADLDELIDGEERLLVELYTTGCGICASMEPVLGTVARATDATVAMVDLGAVPVTGRFDVSSVPTLLLFVDGDLVDRRADGFVGAEEVVSFVDAG